MIGQKFRLADSQKYENGQRWSKIVKNRSKQLTRVFCQNRNSHGCLSQNMENVSVATCCTDLYTYVVDSQGLSCR